jgi:hypothetical protein
MFFGSIKRARNLINLAEGLNTGGLADTGVAKSITAVDTEERKHLFLFAGHG